MVTRTAKNWRPGPAGLRERAKRTGLRDRPVGRPRRPGVLQNDRESVLVVNLDVPRLPDEQPTDHDGHQRHDDGIPEPAVEFPAAATMAVARSGSMPPPRCKAPNWEVWTQRGRGLSALMEDSKAPKVMIPRFRRRPSNRVRISAVTRASPRAEWRPLTATLSRAATASRPWSSRSPWTSLDRTRVSRIGCLPASGGRPSLH